MPRTPAAAFAVAPVASVRQRLKPPESLSEAAKAEFIRIVMAEKADHFRKSDLPLLCQYCESAALAERAVRELQREDTGAGWLAKWEKANRNLVALSARLRICPQSRQPNNPKRPQPTSYYEQMRLEEAGFDEES
jgi:phage terminase small subunit